VTIKSRFDQGSTPSYHLFDTRFYTFRVKRESTEKENKKKKGVQAEGFRRGAHMRCDKKGGVRIHWEGESLVHAVAEFS